MPRPAKYMNCERCGLLFKRHHAITKFCSWHCNKSKNLTWVKEPSGCIRCTSHWHNNMGYPMLMKKTVARQILIRRYGGYLPQDIVTRHSCDNPACINPGHLDIGTYQDNTQDMVKRGRARNKYTKEHATL